MNQKQPHQDQKRILAVDDEPDLTTICSLALEHYGFKVANKSKRIELSNTLSVYYS
jgi:DNA-binding response OmpR family regulator